MANEVFVAAGDEQAAAQRARLQRGAMTSLKLLAYLAELAMGQGCILAKQYERIAQGTYDVQNMLGAWMASDPALRYPQVGGSPHARERLRGDGELFQHVPGVPSRGAREAAQARGGGVRAGPRPQPVGPGRADAMRHVRRGGLPQVLDPRPQGSRDPGAELSRPRGAALPVRQHPGSVVRA